MNKKILYLTMIVGLFFGFMFTVRALNVKAPSSVPAIGSEVYGVIDGSAIDFSKVKFTTATGGTLTGKSDLKKLRLATSYLYDNNNDVDLDSNWFSAYCLNENDKYPDTNLAYIMTQSNDPHYTFDAAVVTALREKAYTEEGIKNLLLPTKHLAFSELIATAPEEYMDGENIKYGEIINALYDDTTNSLSIVISISKLSYVTISTSPVTTEITGAQLNSAVGNTTDGDVFKISLTKDTVLFNKYKVAEMPAANGGVLWVLEHSYPNLPMDTMLVNAGVSKDTLTQELLALHGLADVSADEAAVILENHIYATVQYAVWKVADSTVDGEKLGGELQGSNELNKLYQYLIKARDYSSYSTATFENKLSVVRPTNKTEIYEETSETIKYGPYSFKNSLLGYTKVNLTSTNSKIVNASGAEISFVKEDEKFYVLVNKKSVSGEVKVNAVTVGGYTFSPATSRGRIYYAHDPLVQSVGTGGIIKDANAETSFTIITSPKTGIESVGTVFILSLIIFSLGYVLITYRNKSYQL